MAPSYDNLPEEGHEEEEEQIDFTGIIFYIVELLTDLLMHAYRRP